MMTSLPALGLVVLAGCAGSVFPPALPPAAASVALPASPEERAQVAVDRIVADCEVQGRACVSYVQDDIYPPIQIPSTDRYFVTSQPQEVRSLGFQLRYDWGGYDLDVERGNTLTWDFNQDPPGRPGP